MREGLAQLGRWSWLAAVALALAAVSVYLVVDGVTWEAAIPACMAALLVLNVMRTRTRIAIESAEQMERLYPAMVAARNPRSTG